MMPRSGLELAPKRRLFELADWSAYWGEDDVLARACDRRLRPKAGVWPSCSNPSLWTRIVCVCPRHWRTKVVPALSTRPGSTTIVPFCDAPARLCRRRRSARLGRPWTRCCSSSARARTSRSRLRPNGGPARRNSSQASRSSGVDRSSKPAISASISLRTGFRARSCRLPPRPATGDGPPECWRAEASWIADFMRSPAQRCGRPGRAPLGPKQG